MDIITFDEHVARVSAQPATPLMGWHGGAAPSTRQPFPYHDIKTRTTTLAAAIFGTVEEAAVQGQKPHTIVVSYTVLADGTPDFSVWCGDRFLEGGTLSSDEATKRITEALDATPALTTRTRRQLASEMQGFHAQFAPSSACDFWKSWRRSKGEALCNHTDWALRELAQAYGGAQGLRDALVNAYEQFTGVGAPSTAAQTSTPLSRLAFRVPILIEGDRGAGKTVESRAFARENNFHMVEVGGNQGIEAPDLLGYLVPVAAGEMVWKDGPVAEAFRTAAAGNKTVLILDELLRIPTNELSLLLTALSPDQGNYRLRTGRILSVENGIGKEEVIECPRENLAVIATTNIGSEYDVGSLDPALAERFYPIRKDTSEAQLLEVLTSVAKTHKLSKKTVDRCMAFYKGMVAARKQGMMNQTPTTRTMVRALELSASDDEVKEYLDGMALLWVARTSEGHPVPEQLTTVKELLDKLF